jgi:thiol-disulfide isomerase/thioredoxin
MRFFLYFLAILVLAGPAVATDIFVGNKPYEGAVYGTASDVNFVLSELAEALGLDIEEVDDGWTLDGTSVPTTVYQNRIWISLSALPEDLVRVVRSEELNTIDLYLKERAELEADVSWANNGTIIFFYADWSEACQAMEQTMAYIAQSPTVKVEFLNIDYPSSDVYRRRVRLFDGGEIPFFVILDKRGRKIDSFSGFFTYAELLDKLKASFSKVK